MSVEIEDGGKVIRGRVVEEEDSTEEKKWDKEIQTEKGRFLFREIPELNTVICVNGETDTKYVLDLSGERPECSCPNFVITKRKGQLCKHLEAAKEAGYNVPEIPQIDIPVEKREINTIAPKGKMFDVEKQLALYTPVEQINNEQDAIRIITEIIGKNARFGDVIEKIKGTGVEEISADVVISLAQKLGIAYKTLEIEIQTAKLNLGEIYLDMLSDDKKERYEKIVTKMPEVTVVMRAKITTAAGWMGKDGVPRYGVGTKEEVLTLPRLKDLAARGSNFVQVTAETKSVKKSILNCLPITSSGLLTKIKEAYGWE